MVFIKILFFILISTSSWANLPKMLTKVPIDSIRFLSFDGKITLYQKSTGSLALATHYNTDDIIKTKPYSQFLVSSEPKSSLLAIEVDQSFSPQTDATKLNDIYLLKRKEDKAKKMTKGKDAQVHLQGSFISYYHPKARKLFFHRPTEKKPSNTISLTNTLNPYFIPDRLMIDANTILYTDINPEGISGVLYYNRSTQELRPLFKSAEKGTRLELCLFGNQLIIGEFSYPGMGLGTNIFSMKAYGNLMKNKITSLYSSENSDIGHLTATTKKLYFIRDLGPNGPLNNRISELFSLNPKTKKLKQVSQLKKVFQVINMDGRIIIPLNGEFYVAEGAAKFNDDKIEGKK